MKKIVFVSVLGLGAWVNRRRLGEMVTDLEASVKAWRLVRNRMRTIRRAENLRAQREAERAYVARRLAEVGHE